MLLFNNFLKLKNLREKECETNQNENNYCKRDKKERYTKFVPLVTVN